ncbi:MAG: hypothetical protein WD118_09095 [Phycisphaeraceae bacterium]
MQEKYHDEWSFQRARLRRGLVRSLLKPVCRWRPIDQPAEGYTLVIGCPAAMAKVLHANLLLVRQQRREHLREIIIAFDVVASRADASVLDELRRRFADLPLRFVFYTPMQAAVLDAIGWAWCYCWLNWALPLGSVNTRYAIVHDLDALLLRDDIFEQRYRVIQERGDRFVGVNHYHGNGLTPSDRLAVTFEMILDAADLRAHCRPIDLFNRVMRHDGRRVEFDTLLYPQVQRGRASLLPLKAEDMVHPTQLVCQYVELQRRRRYTPPERNNLMMLAYFHYLAGDPLVLEQHRLELERARGPVLRLFGKQADVARLSRRHVAWLAAQIERVEHAVAGEVRGAVRSYIDSLEAFVHRNEHAALADRAAGEPVRVMAVEDAGPQSGERT